MANKDIFKIDENKRIPTHYTIRKFLVEKVKAISIEKKLSESRVVDLILENYFNNK